MPGGGHGGIVSDARDHVANVVSPDETVAVEICHKIWFARFGEKMSDNFATNITVLKGGFAHLTSMDKEKEMALALGVAHQTIDNDEEWLEGK